jgi:hypothetical protein
MTDETTASSQSKTPATLIAAAWIVVCIPLAWGVYNTALGAAKLFTHLHAANPPAQVKAP